mgnify:FL=1
MWDKGLKLARHLGMYVLILFSGPLTALEFTDAFVRGLPPGQKNTAAFFTVANAEATAWTIARVSTDAADRVEMHRHEHNNGMMTMREVDELTIEAQSSLQFAPGGLHLMLIGLKQPLREGDRVTLQFTNVAGESVHTEFPVISVVNEHRHH